MTTLKLTTLHWAKLTVLTHTSTPVVCKICSLEYVNITDDYHGVVFRVVCPVAMETLDYGAFPYATVTCTHSEIVITIIKMRNLPMMRHFALNNSAISDPTTPPVVNKLI